MVRTLLSKNVFKNQSYSKSKIFNDAKYENLQM